VGVAGIVVLLQWLLNEGGLAEGAADGGHAQDGPRRPRRKTRRATAFRVIFFSVRKRKERRGAVVPSWGASCFMTPVGGTAAVVREWWMRAGINLSR